MDTLITDGDKYEVSKKVADLLRSLFISSYEYRVRQGAIKYMALMVRWVNYPWSITIGNPIPCASGCGIQHARFLIYD